MTNEELIYWSGLTDGEGTITISRSLKKKRYKNPLYYLRLSISNTNKAIVEAFVQFFGFVKIFTVKSRYYKEKAKKWKLVWNAVYYSVKAYNIIKQLLPYLRIKKRQAEIAIAFQEGKKAYKDSSGLPSEEVVFREGLYQQIIKLNRRGKEIA